MCLFFFHLFGQRTCLTGSSEPGLLHQHQHPASWHHFTSTAVRRKSEREGRLKIAPSLPPLPPTLTYSLSLTSSSAFFISPLLRFSCSCSLHPDNHFIYFLLTSFCRGCWSDSWPVLITGGGKGHVSTK